MTEFEYIIACLLIPMAYAVIYIAGKYDVLALIAKYLAKKAEELNRKETEHEHDGE